MQTRSLGLKAHVFFLLLGAACATSAPDTQGSAANAEAAPSATGSASASTTAALSAAAPVPISPTFGGSVLSVGQYQAELAVYVDGGIEALVFDAQGTAVPPELVTGFSAAFNVDGNAKVDARLLWDATTKRFQGQHGLDTQLVGRPIDVTLVIEGKTQSGVLAVYTPLPRAKLEGSARVQGDAALPSASAKAKLGSGAKALGDVTARAKPTSAKAGASATASAKLAVPKPKLVVSSRSTAEKEKSGAGASVKAKAKLGFGN
jgi:hypothetical protein